MDRARERLLPDGGHLVALRRVHDPLKRLYVVCQRRLIVLFLVQAPGEHEVDHVKLRLTLRSLGKKHRSTVTKAHFLKAQPHEEMPRRIVVVRAAVFIQPVESPHAREHLASAYKVQGRDKTEPCGDLAHECRLHYRPEHTAMQIPRILKRRLHAWQPEKFLRESISFFPKLIRHVLSRKIICLYNTQKEKSRQSLR